MNLSSKCIVYKDDFTYKKKLLGAKFELVTHLGQKLRFSVNEKIVVALCIS